MVSFFNRFLFFILIVNITSTSYGATDVKQLRISNTANSVRIVLDLTDQAEYKIFTIDNPYRVIIDLKNTHLNTSIAQPDVEKTGIQSIRNGVQDSNNLRIVFDLKQKMTVSSFVLAPEGNNIHRLVLDLKHSKTVQAKSVSQINQGKRDVVIAIDAGHGGTDGGATGKFLKEKDVVLSISKEIKKIIDGVPGYSAFLIRDGDYYIPLDQRPAIAREKKADLFISIHADAFTTPQPRGASVYSLSLRGASGAMAKFIEDSENSADERGGLNLSERSDILVQVLGELTLDATMDAGVDVGEFVLGSLKKGTKMHSSVIQKANFAVLRSPDVPSILIETGFISNPDEEKNLGSAKYRKNLASAIFKGIDRYFQANPIPGTYIAWSLENKNKLIDYTVKSGDTLSGIAYKHRINMSQIKAINHLKSDSLRIGQVLKLPLVSN
ncbi:N-acetylmuramoyl-L-alanine amidase [Marinicellulosiphila megalodicopiae]|uniref:N-acetylmuramoyl-L-alanine amidase n=1 Tax=Marinicellulosiphila megalodicopiae TaxID=2724896 RepID=UPI003BB04854